MAAEEERAELVFREQSDGRKVARLASGKIVLVHYDHLDEVRDGEKWLVRLHHDVSFCAAFPEQLLTDHAAEQPTTQDVRLPTRRSTTSVVRAGEEEPMVSIRSRPRQDGPVPETQAPSDSTGEADDTDADDDAAPSDDAVAASRRLGNHTASPEELITAGERVAFFVDAANADAACRDVGYWLDYAKALQWAKGKGSLHGGYFYVADLTQEQDSKQTRFLDHLNYAGYVIRLKRVKRIIDNDTGEERFKANVDTEIIVDMLNTADTWDVAWLVSGDSDYERLVDILRSRGKRVYVLSSRNVLSKELAYAANQPVFRMEELAGALARAE